MADETGYRVLVADDDRDIATMLARYLRAKGVAVVEAYNGNEALAQLQRDPPDALILDLMLPGLSGQEVLARVRALPGLARLPVVVLSASITSSAHEAEVAARLNASAAFRKPVPLRELLQRLDELVSQYNGGFRETAELTSPRPVPVLEPRPGDSGPQLPPSSGACTPANVARVVVDIFDRELTAVLHVHTRNVTRSLYFHGGLLARAETPLGSERLGAQLVNEGVVDREQDAQVATAMEVRGLRYGEAAVEELGLAPSVLVEALDRQQASILARAMLARDATYEMKRWRTLSRLQVSFRLDPVELIQRACVTTMRSDEALGVLSQIDLSEGDQVEHVLRTDAFEDRLFLFTRLRPRTVVPRFIMDSPPLTEAIARLASREAEALPDLCALVLSGALHIGPHDTGQLTSRRSTVLAGGRGGWRPRDLAPEHQQARERVAQEWLRTAGLSAYEVLGLPTSATDDEIIAARDARIAEFGPPAWSHADLGPAAAVLAVVRAQRDDAAMVLLDPALRRRYDAQQSDAEGDVDVDVDDDPA